MHLRESGISLQRNSSNNRSRRVSIQDKFAKIAEIQGILDEKGKSKDWILQEIKRLRLRLKLPVRPTMNTFEILKACPVSFVLYLLNVLKSDDVIIQEKLPPTRTYHWFYTDVVASSHPKMTTAEQVHKIMVLNELLSRTETFKQRDPESTVIFSSGDGYAIGFSDSPENPLRLAIELHKLINKYNQLRTSKDKIYIRIGIDSGPVYFMKDLTGNHTVWGYGIIMARRVMDLGDKMHVLASVRIANDIRKLSTQYKTIMHPIGNYAIKWEEPLLIYNIHGDGFGNKNPPPALKVDEPKPSDQNIKKFLFSKVELKLDVTDPKTMMIHHTQLWNLINITKELKDQIFCYLDGDIPKDFPDLNVIVKDEDGCELNIISLNVNKPYHKEFIVQLNRPLKQNQKGRILKLEWDWEEPERSYVYKFASGCKKFRYVFTAPKGVELKHRVLKVDPETGYKTHAMPPASVKYLKDRTEITWQTSNLQPYDAYLFNW